MKILVTGASGFAGSYLIRELATQPDNAVYATTQTDKTSESENLHWHQCDLLDTLAVNELIDSIEPDQIYHLAAYSSPGESFKEPLKSINETIAIQVNLFEACILAGITPRVLVVSSGQIYSKTGRLPLNEESTLDSNSPYAVAKLAQENLAAYYGNRGFESIIARPFNHIGPGQSLGFLVSDLANQIVKAEAGSGPAEIRVGNLSSKRDFTDVRDIVSAYVGLMMKGKVTEVYNICSGKSVSGQEILSLLIEQVKCKITVTIDQNRMRPSDIADLYGDHSKLTEATGWEPHMPLAQTLKETLDYWRNKI